MAEYRSLFDIVFGKQKENKNASAYGTQVELLNNYQAVFTNFDGALYDQTLIRACIDAIARNAAKLNPKHIRYTANGVENIYGRVQTLLGRRPNELMNAYDFYYKVISQLYLDNNAFIYIQRDKDNIPTGLYPISSGNYQLLEYKGDVYIKFFFNSTGKTYTASLKDDVVHLKRFFCKNDITGGNNAPILKAMSFKHILSEGIINAIKTTQGIKGVLKTTKALLKPEDVKRNRDQFVADFLSASDGSGIAGLDATSEFTPVNINPQTATDSQVSEINNEIYEYFGINEKILQSAYNEDEWNAFYESIIEPIAIMLGLEFTSKLFSAGERWHGNEIVFEANRLQYASNETKVKVVSALLPFGILKKNEVREIFNLAPVEGGEEFIQSLNNINSALADGYQGGE